MPNKTPTATDSSKTKARERFHSGYEPPHAAMRLIECVQLGYAKTTKLRVEQDNIDVNEQDERGMTALHYAAALGARQCLRVLVNSGKCNYLLKDKRGRYASELAFSCGKDYAVGVLLSKKQAKQAHELGLPVWDK
ncbi:ankyrin repeat domain-containing protein [Pseudomonas reactans]|uniref:Ankyrin repeat domain-containing protein n=1 Tax=Pseudomonas reactans TaxID=117680 RepID=A0A7Y8KLX5_9PSED|nr:ankyrin repeat domain-containing protein [Pseudomonas reactans]NWE92845.1 ankyrin repeat domain-containing protein [Pseudomonas reactans]